MSITIKNTKLLIKLNQEGKLELVEPSEDISASYIIKSESHFESANILLKAGKLEESVSMSYYGMYHCLTALLFRCGIKSENHTASILLLKELFNECKLAELIGLGKKERIEKQYYTNFQLAESDCTEMIRKAESFILDCKKLIKQLNQGRILQARQELRNFLENPA